jgi:trehalose synthase
MLHTVETGVRSIEAYRGVVPDEILDGLIEAAEPLRGARVVHVNATAYGGGVSELLNAAVPLWNGLGVITDWKLIAGDDAFFRVTKKIHNALQGAPGELSAADRDLYLATAERNAKAFEERYDYVVIHDPQPAGMLANGNRNGAKWIWRCHIDTGQPNADVWQFLRALLEGYDAAVYTMREFVPADLPIENVQIIPPAIDPLSPKNLALPRHLAHQILAWIGIDFEYPLVTQISRFDPWKDPLGVIEAYRMARESIPNLQLALVGSMALDDPEGSAMYQTVCAAARDDPLIHVFTNLTGVSNIEVNAFQMLSDVVVQKSIREGFGLVVSEALWKGTPVVAGRAGGIPLQMADDAGGVLVDSVAACGAAIVRLLGDPDMARALGASGRDRVRRRFLLPRLLLDFAKLLAGLGAAQLPVAQPPVAQGPGSRDPVCGMTVERQELELAHAGQVFHFCSEECRRRFRKNPKRFLSNRSAL